MEAVTSPVHANEMLIRRNETAVWEPNGGGCEQTNNGQINKIFFKEINDKKKKKEKRTCL